MLERPVRSGEYQPPTVTPSRRRVGSNGLPRVIISVSARENQQQHPGNDGSIFFFLNKTIDRWLCWAVQSTQRCG